MASSDNEIPAPIIIKKIKKNAGGHHGGAWKVAYADFVTAMMAFFLLLWLLDITTDEQKNAISNYFDPIHPKVATSKSGSGGILGGLSISRNGAMVTNIQPIISPPVSAPVVQGDTLGDMKNRRGETEDDDAQELIEKRTVFADVALTDYLEEEQLRAEFERRENEQFEKVQQQITQQIEQIPELADMKDQLLIDITPEGLRIQIIDKEGRSMFPTGSAAMHGFMRDLLTQVTKIIAPQPNQISVRGHTDSTPYAAGAKYDNWNLSADRALASRQVMMDSALPIDRIENVIGRADREHLLPDEPTSPRNRRISIVLLRQNIDKEVEEALQKKHGFDTKKPQILPSHEDREDIPALERRVTAPSAFIIENDGHPVEMPATINTAPQPGQSEKQPSSHTTPRPLSAPNNAPIQQQNPQILEFP